MLIQQSPDNSGFALSTHFGRTANLNILCVANAFYLLQIIMMISIVISQFDSCERNLKSE